MALTSGTKLGPYEIQSPLGAGGMGEVYRARDPRLERTVAIKVLNAQLVASSELRARFEREAKIISQLQHPHICVLHDVGNEGPIDYLVMEFLQGESLADRLRKGPLAAEQVLTIAIEIADALEKAHRAGVVHRDLKPGNVMLTKSGAKLLDFGLAKPFGATVASGKGSGNSPSIFAAAMTQNVPAPSPASPLSGAGAVIGTVQYMSPEQIQGVEADARSDIFSFGVMLFEMVTGKRTFEGKTQASIVGQILAVDPPSVSILRPQTPSGLDRVIRLCLDKDPDERIQTAHDLKLQLQGIAAGGSQEGDPAVVSSRRKKTATVLTAATIAGWLIAAALGVLLLIYVGRVTSARQPVHTSIESPAGFDFFSVVDGAPVLSPDGQQVAFLVNKKDTTFTPGGGSLYLLRLSTGESAPVAGAQSALFPFWSPDGKYLGFFSEGKLKKVPVAGGTVQILCDAPEGRGGSWNEQGTIIFAPRIAGSLQSVSDGGGTPVEITKSDSSGQKYTDRDPYFLPDGKHFLFVRRAKDSGSVYAGALDSSATKQDGDIKQILPIGSNVAYSDGYLFYLKEGALIAQEFDPSSLTFKGKPISIASNVEFAPARNEGSFSVSGNVLLYRPTSVVNRELVWFDLSGKEVDHWGEPAPYLRGKFFASTQTALLSRATPGGNGDSLWISDVARKTVNRLTQDSDRAATGAVSPDGKDVWISNTTGYVSDLTRKSLSASGMEEKVLENFNGNLVLFDISRDGRYLLFNHQDPKTDFDIYTMDLQGEKKLVPVLNGPSAERNGRVSPDSKWLAYISNETGTDELFVTSFPVPGSRWQVSSGGATSTGEWSADGKNLRYRNGEKILNVEVHSGASKPDFSTPKELLSLPTNIIDIALLPDGKRILAVRPSGNSAPVPINFVLNWEHLTH
jgi:eukaryotic-like serine/threonine-protein kinase